MLIHAFPPKFDLNEIMIKMDFLKNILCKASITGKWLTLSVLLLLQNFSSHGQEKAESYILTPAGFNNQLLQNTVAGLAKDEAGMLWNITQFGCYRFDGFNTNVHLTSNTSLLNSDRYRSIFDDRANKRLIVAGENDFYFIQNSQLVKKNEVQNVLVLNNYNYLLSYEKRLKKVFGDSKKSLIGSALLFFKSDTLILQKKFCFSYTQNRFLPDFNIGDIDPARLIYRNGVQYYFAENGLYVLQFSKAKITKKLVLSVNHAKHIIANTDDRSIWFEDEKKVYKISLPSVNIKRSFNKPANIDFINSVCEDEENNHIYLGTIKDGVLLLRFNKVKQLAPDNYTSSYAYNKILNSYVIATKKGIAYQRVNQEKTTLLAQKNIRDLFIFSDQQNRIWYQHNNDKILILEPDQNKITDSIPFSDFMVDVEQPDKNRFIIANHYTIFNYESNKKKRDTLFTARNTELIYDFCLVNKNMYVSTSNGLYIVDPNLKITAHLLPGISVRKSMPLQHNMLAIGSYGKGVFFLKHNTLYASPVEEFTQLSAVVSMSIDQDSAFWVICNKAVFAWNKPDIDGKLITQPDHILSVETDLPCNELNGGLNPDIFPNREIVLPSSDGLLLFNKSDLIKKTRTLKTAIGKITIDDSMVLNPKTFKVPAGTQSVKLFIDAAMLSTTSNAAPEFRVKELDSNWQKIPLSRILEFSRLPKGEYHLEVRNKNKLQPITLSSFKVLPYWYETGWAKSIFFSIALLLIYVIVLIRTRILKKNQVKLEGIIEEKTKSLQENISKLNTSEKELKRQYRYKNKLYSILMHDLKSPLTFLSTYSIQQLNQKSTIEKESMRVIAKSSSELSSFINEFLFWLGNQTNPENIVLQETDVSALMNELTSFYQSFAAINNNKLFYFDKTNDIRFNTDPDRLKIIIRNLLDNANKYTSNGVIKVSSTVEDYNTLIIIIEDSGKGLPENIINLINNHSNVDEISPSINANHKMGLMISRELIAQLNGQVTVVSNENTGTSFTIRFAAKNYKH